MFKVGNRILPNGVMSPSEYSREAVTRALRAVTCETPADSPTQILTVRPGWRDADEDETPGQCEPELRRVDSNTIQPRVVTRTIQGGQRGWSVPPPPPVDLSWVGISYSHRGNGIFRGEDPTWAWLAAILGTTWFGVFEITAALLFINF